MGIYFYKLFDLMARKNLKKTDLSAKAGISRVTLTKMVNNGTVETSIIDKLCRALDCQPGDIMEYIEDSTPQSEEAQKPQNKDL